MLKLIHANLIDGSGGALQRDVEIAMESGEICAVGKNLPAATGGAVIDLQGAYVLPGLIDMHTHVSGSSGFDHLEPGQRINTYDYTEAREGFLDWGVLTVRSCGDVCPDILDFCADVEAGRITAPRVIAAGPWVQGVGAHPLDTVYGGNPITKERACFCADDESDLTDIVCRIKAMGSDWLKLFYGGNPMLFGERPMTRMSEQCLRALTRIGHENGMKVMVHIDGATDMLAVAEAGADTIEHSLAAGYGDDAFSPELIRLLRERKIAVIPTMISTKRFGGGGEAFALASYETLKRAVRAMHEAGVTVLPGCDSGAPFLAFGESLHAELECFVDAGFTPMEAICAATSVSAGVLGRAEEIGRVAPGYAADLLVVGGDPLENIANTRNIQLVIRAGAIVRDRICGCKR